MRSLATESIAYKLMGIYAFIQAISFWSSIGNIYSFRNYSLWVGTAFYMLLAGWLSSIIALIILGAILIGKSHRIATLPFRESEIDSTSALSELDIMSIAFSILGVYFFLSAFRRFVVFFANTMPHIVRSESFSLNRFWAQTLKYGWPDLLGTLVELALGIWLFFGGSALARFWKRRQATQTNQSEARKWWKNRSSEGGVVNFPPHRKALWPDHCRSMLPEGGAISPDEAMNGGPFFGMIRTDRSFWNA